MEKLAETILIELVKIAETDIKWIRATKECAEKEGVNYNYYVATIAWAYALQFQKVKEKILAEKN